MSIGYFSPTTEPRVRWRGRRSPQLTSMSEAALNVLKGRPPTARPMMSRAGIRAEARRVRSIMRAHMRDHQLIGDK
ncbi:MAG: hypothetical protein ACRDLF_05950 [Solirubrobacteraceae bacterium]